MTIVMEKNLRAQNEIEVSNLCYVQIGFKPLGNYINELRIVLQVELKNCMNNLVKKKKKKEERERGGGGS